MGTKKHYTSITQTIEQEHLENDQQAIQKFCQILQTANKTDTQLLKKATPNLNHKKLLQTIQNSTLTKTIKKYKTNSLTRNSTNQIKKTLQKIRQKQNKTIQKIYT